MRKLIYLTQSLNQRFLLLEWFGCNSGGSQMEGALWAWNVCCFFFSVFSFFIPIKLTFLKVITPPHMLKNYIKFNPSPIVHFKIKFGIFLFYVYQIWHFNPTLLNAPSFFSRAYHHLKSPCGGVIAKDKVPKQLEAGTSNLLEDFPTTLNNLSVGVRAEGF